MWMLKTINMLNRNHLSLTDFFWFSISFSKVENLISYMCILRNYDNSMWVQCLYSIHDFNFIIRGYSENLLTISFLYKLNAICCPSNFAETNGLLSLLLIGHQRGQKGGSDDWFIERIEVRSKGFVLLKYLFHAWTDPFRLTMFGVSKMESSQSKTKKPSYFLIRD